MDKLEDIINMSEEELIKRHNKMTNYSPDGSFYLREYYRRQANKLNLQTSELNKKMLKYTKWMTIMTFIVMVATIINVVVFLIGK